MRYAPSPLCLEATFGRELSAMRVSTRCGSLVQGRGVGIRFDVPAFVPAIDRRAANARLVF